MFIRLIIPYIFRTLQQLVTKDWSAHDFMKHNNHCLLKREFYWLPNPDFEEILKFL